MNKIELINEINSIVDFGVNGKVKIEDMEFHGHPNFYILHYLKRKIVGDKHA